MNNAIVQTESLSKQYASLTALDGCTLSVERGEVFGLLGPNGAGKTTLLRLILGFLRPTRGTARVDELQCYSRRVDVHRRLTYLPGEARLFRTMRGWGVLKFFAAVRADGNYQRAVQLAERLELDLSRWVGFMSTGMRQKLALAACLSVDTPLVILDEPTSNLDPNVRRTVMRMVAESRLAGRTVIFSSHVLSEVEDVCDRVGILRGGKLVHLQCMKQLKQQHRIRARLTGPMPELPSALGTDVSIERRDHGELQIETPGELSSLLQWLAQVPLEDVTVQPVGLRAVYERFHSEHT